MNDVSQLVLGAGPDGLAVAQALRLANRHGLIAGATGTGKTVTLQRLAEAFSEAGVAVFAADIKGDLCGLGAAGRARLPNGSPECLGLTISLGAIRLPCGISMGSPVIRCARP